MTGPPDFVGVGVQRAGTSWWLELIASHPGVVKPRLKELHYFNRFAYTHFDGEAIHEYHLQFPRPVNRQAGEWTPRYMYDFWTPPLLARAAPGAKLLVLLRDPIERYRSGFSLGTSMAREPSQAALVQLANDQLRRSLYFEQLMRLLEQFDRTQLLVLQYERCLEDPISQLHRTYEFLELDPHDHVPESVHERVGRKRPSAVLPEEQVRILRNRLADDVTQLARTFTEIDLARWPHFGSAEQ
jgi:hypothetical protein